MCLRLFTVRLNPVVLKRVIKMVKTSVEDLGLQWKPKKCAVAHVKRGVKVGGVSGKKVDESAIEYHVLMMVSSTSSWEYLRVLCRKICLSWGVQQKRASNDCHLFGQAPCPMTIGW